MDTTLPWVQTAPDEYNNLTTVSESIETPQQLEEFLEELERHPNQRVAWSWHASRGASRQRINNLRKSPRFVDNPHIRFESRVNRQDGELEGFYIFISWNPTP